MQHKLSEKKIRNYKKEMHARAEIEANTRASRWGGKSCARSNLAAAPLLSANRFFSFCRLSHFDSCLTKLELENVPMEAPKLGQLDSSTSHRCSRLCDVLSNRDRACSAESHHSNLRCSPCWRRLSFDSFAAFALSPS